LEEKEFSKDAIITLQAAPQPGYYFVQWQDTLTGAVLSEKDSVNLAMGCNQAVTGVFYPSSTRPQVSIEATPGGTINFYPQPLAGGYLPGTLIQITASPDDGFELAFWSGDASGKNTTIEVIANRDKEITAHFEKYRRSPLFWFKVVGISNAIGVAAGLVIIVVHLFRRKKAVKNVNYLI
jgi:hypothetical protein